MRYCPPRSPARSTTGTLHVKFVLRHWRLATVLLLVVALGSYLLLRRIQGPLLSAYRVELRPLVQTVVATGRVVSASRAQVGSRMTGVLAERRVREGDVVQAGDVLAVLHAPELEARVREAEATLAQLQQFTRPQAQAALREAQLQVQQTTREAQRRQALYQRRLIAREVMEQADEAAALARTRAEQAALVAAALASGKADEQLVQERLVAARAALDQTLIRAEVAGTVLTRNAEPGDLVQPGKVLFELARAGQTELLVPVDEKNLSVLALDQPAQCVADAYPARPFAARIHFIAPSIDAARGSVDLRLTIDPMPDFLRTDMTVSVNVQTARREQALVLANDALTAVDGEQAVVWRVVDGKLQRRAVRLGLRSLALTEITEGLQAGDWVLTDAAGTWQEGAAVRVAAQALPDGPVDASARNELPVKFD